MGRRHRTPIPLRRQHETHHTATSRPQGGSQTRRIDGMINNTDLCSGTTPPSGALPADDRRSDEQSAIPKSNQHSTPRFAKSDDGVSFLRDVREKRLYQIGGRQPPATPSGPPLTNTLQAPRHDPSPEVGSAGISPMAGLAPNDRLIYLEHCGNCATTNSRRTMNGCRGR